MTQIATRPKTERRSATASDGARPHATPVHRRELLSTLFALEKDDVVIVRNPVAYVLVTYFAARDIGRHRRRANYTHSHHRPA
jgi:hypothetical protein